MHIITSLAKVVLLASHISAAGYFGGYEMMDGMSNMNCYNPCYNPCSPGQPMPTLDDSIYYDLTGYGEGVGNGMGGCSSGSCSIGGDEPAIGGGAGISQFPGQQGGQFGGQFEGQFSGQIGGQQGGQFVGQQGGQFGGQQGGQFYSPAEYQSIVLDTSSAQYTPSGSAGVASSAPSASGFASSASSASGVASSASDFSSVAAPCASNASASASSTGFASSSSFAPTVTPLYQELSQPAINGGDQQFSVLLNGNIPVNVQPSSITVGENTYPIVSSASAASAAGAASFIPSTTTVEPLFTPEELAAGAAIPIVALEGQESVTAAQLKKEQEAAKDSKNCKKTGKKSKASKKTKAAAANKKKNGVAGVSTLAALAILPLVALLF
ncbi:hypothetical protein NEHOM01_0089 [Nematocida homosporus]|uniref:uncharacterized protein n=1 Tax=Nematocida homosporus TaxID=1912981 RepID=UPI00221F7E1F|nr:uncharacterized protein NEHOM01_0089 [Nematocida homosporus]KAI5184344.1 hypothetical protein NEHOM01_0089 [Nematocida homosporus]